jgi:hypothetical protein
MTITDKTKFKIISREDANVIRLVEELNDDYNNLKEDNLIIDILDKGDLSLEELLMFLDLSNTHRTAKRSFVIANDAINIDVIPEELFVVPTMQEAEDIISMEELERELGF